ncbi:hypothetical protein C8R44DRAFT_744832 [Mycena epipterygia]|nr:hypothetical protein C8R44DRAFT_744832 [Mycena epipterygia]
MYSTGFEVGLSARIGVGAGTADDSGVYGGKKGGSLPRCEITVDASRRRRALDGGIQLKGGLGLGIRNIGGESTGCNQENDNRQLRANLHITTIPWRILKECSARQVISTDIIMYGLVDVDRDSDAQKEGFDAWCVWGRNGLTEYESIDGSEVFNPLD